MIIITTYVPRTYAKVKSTEQLITFVAGRRKLYTPEQVKSYAQELLDEALDITIIETKEWINTFVPKRSADLRVSLIKYLERSLPPASAIGELRGIRLVLGAGAEINYAKYVDEMTTAQVAHKGTWREHSVDYITKKGIAHHPRAYSKGHRAYLYDPQAVGGYHDKMIDYARERLRTNIAKSIYKFNRGF